MITTRSRLSRRPRRLAAGALVLLALPIAGCGGGDSGGDGDTDLAKVVPAGAAFYGELTVRPEGSLRTSVEALSRKIAKTDDPGAQIITLLDGALKDGGSDKTNFKDDIDPWLGKKVGVAITGLRNPSTPDYAFILAATDTKKALDALKDGEDDVVDRKYKDVGYAYNKSVEQAAVGIGDTLTIGTEAAVKSIIDVDKGADALADTDKLKEARASVTDERLGFFYLDPLSIVDLVGNSTPALGAQAGQLKSLLGGAQGAGIGAALTVAPDALRLETTVKSAAAAGKPGTAAATLAGLPAGSVFAVGLGDIGGGAQQIVGQLGQLGGIYAGVLSQFQAITGLDLQRDVLSWMGPGGLFVRAKGITDIGGALVVETTSEQKTTEFIAAARRLITRFGADSGLTLRPYSGSGAKGFQVTTDELPFPVVVATGGGKFVIAVGENSVKEALKPTATLGDDARFKATAVRLGMKPQLYADVRSILGFLDLALTDDPGFAKVKPYLQAFVALAAGSEQSGGRTKSSIVLGVE